MNKSGSCLCKYVCSELTDIAILFGSQLSLIPLLSNTNTKGQCTAVDFLCENPFKILKCICDQNQT